MKLKGETMLYRVYLPKNKQMSMDYCYPIGCNSTYTGFWTTSKKDALTIYAYLLDMYTAETEHNYIQNEIIQTPLSNVEVLLEEEIQNR